MKLRSLEVHRLPDNVYMVNEFDMNMMYIVVGSEKCLVIDTGTRCTDGFLPIVREIVKGKPYDVILTHGHVDHVGGVGLFEEIHIHPADLEAVTRGNGLEGAGNVFNRRRYSARGFAVNPEGTLPFSMDDYRETDTSKIRWITVREGFTFDLGDRTLEVLEMPGHTPGHIVLLDRKFRILFAGDNVSRILILPETENHKDIVSVWTTGAEKILAMGSLYDVIYAGHLCPAPRILFEDQVELSRRILSGEAVEQFVQADEFRGMLYVYGLAHFTIRTENLASRNYARIPHPEIG